MKASLRWRNLKLFQPTDRQWVSIPDVDLRPGSRLAIVGGQGTGKTSLARFLSGMPTDASVAGEIFLGERLVDNLSDSEVSKLFAFVPTRVEHLFSGIGDTVISEMALSLQFLGLAEDAANAQISETSRLLQIGQLGTKLIDDLSGGEKAIAALACCTVKSPHVVVSDQALDFVSRDNAACIEDCFRRLALDGVITIVTLARTPDNISDYEHCLFIQPGRVLYGKYNSVCADLAITSPHLLTESDQTSFRLLKLRGKNPATHFHNKHDTGLVTDLIRLPLDTVEDRLISPALLDALQIEHQYPRSSFRVGPLSLSALAGTAIGFIGPNGSGKTTLFRMLSLLLPTFSGEMRARSSTDAQFQYPPSADRRHRWAELVLYCFQHADDQLYLPTVEAELNGVAVRLGRNLAPSESIKIASAFGLADVMKVSPFAIGQSAKKMLSIASTYAAAPTIWLLDEPTAGLDSRQVKTVAKAVRNRVMAGATVLIISHDDEFLYNVADETLEMKDGKVVRAVKRPRSQSIQKASFDALLDCFSLFEPTSAIQMFGRMLNDQYLDFS